GWLAGCGKKPAPKAPAAPPVSPAAPAPEKPLIARWHFDGTRQMSADPNASTLHKILALPVSAEYRDQLLQTLARAPFRVLRDRPAETTNDYAALIRPLFEDLLGAESFAEIRGDTNETPEGVFALRLEAARAGLWNTNLAAVLAAWTGLVPAPLPKIDAAA